MFLFPPPYPPTSDDHPGVRSPLKQNKYDDQIPKYHSNNQKKQKKPSFPLPLPLLPSLLFSPLLSFFSLHSSSITVIAVIVFVPRSTLARPICTQSNHQQSLVLENPVSLTTNNGSVSRKGRRGTRVGNSSRRSGNPGGRKGERELTQHKPAEPTLGLTSPFPPPHTY